MSANPRRSEPDLGAFGPTPAPARYAEGTRGAVRPWTAQEDLCLWPVLLRCESERAYIEACRLLCRVLDRTPKMRGRPSAVDLARESVALVEMRTVHLHLAGEPVETLLLLQWLHTGIRNGAPLSWAERARFLPQYVRKPSNRPPQPQITPDHLLKFLERGPGDRTAVVQYCENLRSHTVAKPREYVSAGRPAGPNNADVTAARVRAFVAADVDDEYAITEAWAALFARPD